MTTSQDLSGSFRHVRLLLAREKDHPAGDREEGYDLLAPLTPDNRLDAAEWKVHQAQCRVRWFGEGRADRIGRLRRKPGGQWYFDYEEVSVTTRSASGLATNALSWASTSR